MSLRYGKRWGVPIAIAGFIIIFVLRLVTPDPAEGVLFLMVLPISLLALEDGFRGGLIGAAVALVSLFAWMAINDVSLSALGSATRITLFLGTALGMGALARQRDRRIVRMQQLHLRADRHDDALRMNERVLQNLAVAKMATEMGEHERALPALEDALQSVRSLVSENVDTSTGIFRSDHS